jgi:hypothetical protein
MNIFKSFMGATPPGWRIVRNICLFVVGLLAVVINAAHQVPTLGVPETVTVWLDLISGIISFVALYAQGQGGTDPPPTT